MKKVIIASKNPVKINSVKTAFAKMFKDESFEYIDGAYPSGVSDQPRTDAETLRGALNRAENAIAANPSADFCIGIEGGIEKVSDEMLSFAWVVIKNSVTEGKARTGTFFLPSKIIELIEQGHELGDADDMVFGMENSKQEMGAVGILTKNVITRTSYYTEAVELALIPFVNLKLYE